MFTFCEFVEEMQDIASRLAESSVSAEALARELVEDTQTAREIKLPVSRRQHTKNRPPRTREGFPWLWVVHQLAYRSTPERGINGGGRYDHFYIFPKGSG